MFPVRVPQTSTPNCHETSSSRENRGRCGRARIQRRRRRPARTRQEWAPCGEADPAGHFVDVIGVAGDENEATSACAHPRRSGHPHGHTSPQLRRRSALRRAWRPAPSRPPETKAEALSEASAVARPMPDERAINENDRPFDWHSVWAMPRRIVHASLSGTCTGPREYEQE
jgi:hypothetical protein